MHCIVGKVARLISCPHCLVKERIMNTSFSEAETCDSSKPQVFVESVKFGDGTVHTFEHNSIVVFCGSNNSGKSQALRDIEHLIRNSKENKVVAKEIKTELIGELGDRYIGSRLHQANDGNYWLDRNGLTGENWCDEWKRKSLRYLSVLFVNRLDTEERLTALKNEKIIVGYSRRTVRFFALGI